MVDDQLWKEVNSLKPDIWIWLGDNIYGDTEDMEVMRSHYDLQKSHPDYQQLLTQTEVIGIWDDHDFGANNAGKEYPAKDASKIESFKFLDVPQDHPAWNRKAAYQSYTYKNDDKSIKVILLDTRYYRDELKWKYPGTMRQTSLKNEDGEVLGKSQWVWLEEQLADTTVDLFLLGTGIQLIPYQHQWEKWSNFPKERNRLLKTLAKLEVPLIVISGDRHLSEVSKMDLEGCRFPLYEFTSSSLTSPASKKKDLNEFRVDELIYETNFATMEIQWTGQTPKIQVTYSGKENEVYQQHFIDYNN